MARSARGHTPGLSVADFDVHDDGQIEARLTFSSGDQLGGLSLDRNGDGAVTPEDVTAAREDLRAFLLEAVAVDADGTPCAPTFLDATLTEVDGLLVRGSYACASDATEIEVTLYYLNAPSRGSASDLSYGPARDRARRGIARITAGQATSEAVLTGDHRAIGLHLPRKAQTAMPHRARTVALATAVFLVGVLAYGSWRWRTTRSAWHG